MIQSKGISEEGKNLLKDKQERRRYPMKTLFLINILSNKKKIVKFFQKIRWKNGLKMPKL
jgi:hypothetical protein